MNHFLPLDGTIDERRFPETFWLKACSTVVHSVGLIWSMYLIVLRPLREDAVLMAHRDPTDIITTPLGLTTVVSYVVPCALFTFAISIATSMRDLVLRNNFCASKGSSSSSGLSRETPTIFLRISSGCFSNAVATVIVFLFAILSGASPLCDIYHTLLASVALSVVALTPTFVHDKYLATPMLYYCCTALGPHGLLEMLKEQESNQEFTEEESERPIHSEVQSIHCSYGNINRFTMYGSFSGVVICMILVTLDWGAQIQRWPIPMLLGTVIGNACGAIIGISIEYLNYKSIIHGSTRRQKVF